MGSYVRPNWPHNLMSMDAKFETPDAYNTSYNLFNSTSTQGQNLETYLKPKYDNADSENTSAKDKRDMINYKVLEGHKYEIQDNPDPKAKHPRSYI